MTTEDLHGSPSAGLRDHGPADPLPSARHRRAGLGTPRRRELTALLIVALLTGAATLARWQAPERIAMNDSYWYLRSAQVYAGTDPVTASRVSARLLCRDAVRSYRELPPRARPAARPCPSGAVTLPELSLPEPLSPRYPAIFDSRPAYPLLAAPLVTMLGPWRGMLAATLLLAVLAGLLAYVVARLAGGSRSAGVAAAGLLFVLPTGFWMTRMMAEGAAVAGMLGAVAGLLVAARAGRSRRSLLAGCGLAAGSFVWLLAAKPANGVGLALALLPAAAVLALARSRRRAAAITASVSVAVIGGWFAVSRALGLPGVTETIQDFATGHFRRPDIPDPFGFLLGANRLWSVILHDLLVSPWPVVLLAAAMVVLARRDRIAAALLAAVALSAAVVVAAHPLSTELPRLTLPIWPPVAVGLGLALDLLRAPRPEPARP